MGMKVGFTQEDFGAMQQKLAPFKETFEAQREANRQKLQAVFDSTEKEVDAQWAAMGRFMKEARPDSMPKMALSDEWQTKMKDTIKAQYGAGITKMEDLITVVKATTGLGMVKGTEVTEASG